MIRLASVTFRYPHSTRPVLRDVSVEVPEGELCLVVGGTGSGKSTLLRAVNGLVPHFTGGTMSGQVTVGERDTRTHPPREMADLVGLVGQDPPAGFVTDVVEDELAYGMESLGLPAQVMRRRVEETLDLLGLATLRDRPVSTLSTGEQQRVAIGSVLTMHPHALVLDEPTSALDPMAAEEVLAALQRLVHDVGMTVLLAEHRLERVAAHADRIVYLPGAGQPLIVGSPAEVMARSPVAPPIVELGRAAGWSPLPLSTRDARRAARPLREAMTSGPVSASLQVPSPKPGDPAVSARKLVVQYGNDVSSGPARETPALAGVDCDIAAGEVVAVMGRNGAGKSTLLSQLVGFRRPEGGSVRVLGAAPHALRPGEVLRHVALVPQEPMDVLYASTVAAECAQADRDVNAPAGTCLGLLHRLAPEMADVAGVGDVHPRDLSAGQRLILALAVILAAKPPVVLLDEPTRGLDYAAKDRLAAVLGQLADAGHAIVLASHDVELMAEVASRVIVLADGEVVADGPSQDVLTSSPAFAPQMAKVFAPLPLLTVREATRALGEAC